MTKKKNNKLVKELKREKELKEAKKYDIVRIKGNPACKLGSTTYNHKRYEVFVSYRLSDIEEYDYDKSETPAVRLLVVHTTNKSQRLVTSDNIISEVICKVRSVVSDSDANDKAQYLLDTTMNDAMVSALRGMVSSDE